MQNDKIHESESHSQEDEPGTFATSSPFTLANAFRSAAVLSVVAGVYLFFQALQAASIVGSAAYEVAGLRLGITVVITLFLLLGEKLCRFLDGYE
ncbi:hypothetical protein NFH98_19660 [Halomonas sp. H33-56]|uniref:Uncharacterized protein n=1 Tax=Halomonas sp. RT37 TaxID=2950872 RepID=A0AAU7KH78_9GAMM|nr:hypothetical protein [Halomonas sp. DP5N14-9]MBY5940636.1 hypothetical protein [Halomonas sp. DP5N14-9]